MTVLVDVGGLGLNTGVAALDTAFCYYPIPPYSPNQILNHCHAIGPNGQASPSTPPHPHPPRPQPSPAPTSILTQALQSPRQLTTNPFFSTITLPLQNPSLPIDNNNSLIYTPAPFPPAHILRTYPLSFSTPSLISFLTQNPLGNNPLHPSVGEGTLFMILGIKTPHNARISSTKPSPRPQRRVRKKKKKV